MLSITTTLFDLIKQASTNNLICFKDFMELALYAPELGYYVNERPKIGFKADFITAPTLGGLFARCLAQQIKQVFKEVPANFIEYGAGMGHLAASLGTFIDFEQYIIIEISPILRTNQYHYIKTHCPQMLEKVIWLEDVPENFNGVIFANEVIDAFPVHKFYYHNNQLQEFYVHINEQNNLSWQLGTPSRELLDAFSQQNLREILAETSDYISEINAAITPWLKNIARKLSNGLVLLCDYGFERHEYFHPMRNMGTLMAHHLQRTSSEILANPGQQDITAHVDFTSIAEVTLETNLSLLGYTNLANFLINCGIVEYYPLANKQANEFNILTSPSEMGELFKIIALGKHLDHLPLAGFKSLDYSYKL